MQYKDNVTLMELDLIIKKNSEVIVGVNWNSIKIKGAMMAKMEILTFGHVKI